MPKTSKRRQFPQDASLKHTLQFGIGLHHAGLDERDRKLVERLFVEQKIQVRSRAEAML